jgi:thiamine biosynthesis lipoprotein
MKHENGMLRFSHQAMATEWEILVFHDDAVYSEQAARAAFDTLNRLEQDLSRFHPNSDISRINRAPADEEVVVGVDAFECLLLCRELHEQTFHAFDITIGRLIQYYKNSKNSGQPPASGEIESLLKKSGMHLLKLNENKKSVAKKLSHLSFTISISLISPCSTLMLTRE